MLIASNVKGDEPIHVHAENGDMECKFWLILAIIG
ncbi:MAG: hypothetical protein CFE25_08765 [Chitinophagaceae bacterium BSSC1]|nr:MAG: hypothetical protein CFE25_08765 [Chitinophagaceae bacterium BSSC1]